MSHVVTPQDLKIQDATRLRADSSETCAIETHPTHGRARAMPLPRRTRRGMSLVDSTLAIMVAVVVIVGLLWGLQSVMSSIKATNLRIQLTRAHAVIDQAHDNSGVYANQSLLVFLSGEGFPDKQLTRVSQGNYTFTSPFDTAITIQGDGARDFTITVANLPQAACQVAVSAFGESNSGLESAVVGSTTLTLPVTEAALETACDNTTNTVALTF